MVRPNNCVIFDVRIVDSRDISLFLYHLTHYNLKKAESNVTETCQKLSNLYKSFIMPVIMTKNIFFSIRWKTVEKVSFHTPETLLTLIKNGKAKFQAYECNANLFLYFLQNSPCCIISKTKNRKNIN